MLLLVSSSGAITCHLRDTGHTAAQAEPQAHSGRPCCLSRNQDAPVPSHQCPHHSPCPEEAVELEFLRAFVSVWVISLVLTTAPQSRFAHPRYIDEEICSERGSYLPGSHSSKL